MPLLSTTQRERVLILLSFGAIYFVWGATYLASAFALESFPPFLLVAMRFLIAGILMYGFGMFSGFQRPTWQQWKNASISGFLFLVAGTTGLVWSLQFIDTGIASLLVAFEPLLVVLFLWKLRGQRPHWNSWVGLIIGIIGMIVLVTQKQIITDENTIWGVLVVCISIVSWGFATLFVGSIDLPKSQPQASAMQMLTGGIMLVFIAWIAGDYDTIQWQSVTVKSWWSVVFLVIFGSIVSFSAFNYLLVKVSPDKVATSTYINPVVAMLLGWRFNEEILSGQSIIAAFLLLGGVFFMNKYK